MSKLKYKEINMRDSDFLDLRNGKSFDEFYKRTKKEWELLAAKAMLSIDHPKWIELEDITQFMAMQCLKAVKDWNPEKTPSIRSYVIWICMDTARKYLHHFRNSKGAKRNGPPRYDIPFSDFSEEELHEILSKYQVEPLQENRTNVSSFLSKSNNLEIVSAMMVGKPVGKLMKCKKFRDDKKKYIQYAYDQVAA